MDINKLNIEKAVTGGVMTILVEGLKDFEEDYYPREERLTLTHKYDQDNRKVSELTVSELKDIIRDTKAQVSTGPIKGLTIKQSGIIMFYPEKYNDKIEFHFHADRDYDIKTTASGVEVRINLPELRSFKDIDPLAYKLKDTLSDPAVISQGISTLKNFNGEDLFNMFNKA